MTRSARTLSTYEKLSRLQGLQRLRIERDLADSQAELTACQTRETEAERRLSDTIEDWQSLIKMKNVAAEWLPKAQKQIAVENEGVLLAQTATQMSQQTFDLQRGYFGQALARQDKIDGLKSRFRNKAAREMDDRKIEAVMEMRNTRARREAVK